MKWRSILIFLLVTLTHVCITPFYDPDDNDNGIAFVITDSSGKLQSKNKDEQTTSSSENSATGQTSVEYRTVSSPKKFVNSTVASGISAVINSNPISRGIAVSIAAIYNICGFFQDRHQENEEQKHEQEPEQCGRPIVTGFVENPPDGIKIFTSIPNESGDVPNDTMYVYNISFLTNSSYQVSSGAVCQPLQPKTGQDTIYQQKLDSLKQHDWHSDARLQAIEHTRTNPSARASQSFSIDRSVIECAESYGIAQKDLTHGCMNAYEHQLHTEFIDQITQVTELLDAYYRAEQYRLFLDVVGQGVALGIEANHKHEAVIATRWSNFGHEALSVLIGIGEGLLLGTYNTACFAKNVVRHPIRTTSEIAGGVGTIISAVGRAIGVSLNLGGMYITGNSEEAHRQVQDIYDQTCSLMQECTDNLATMSNREIAKQATAFATEWVLMSKALTFAHSICSRAKPLIAHSISTLRKKPLRKTVIAGAQGTLNKTGKIANRVSDAAKEISKESRLALESFRADYMAKLEPEIVELKKIFDRTHKGFAECANKWIKIDYEHIFGMEFKFNKKGKFRISGFHHDPMGLVEGSGLFEFSDKIVNKSDFYAIRLFHNENYVKTITFFPSHWSREEVVGKICEAYDSFVKNGAKNFIAKDGKYVLAGITKEGVEIEMYVTSNGKMITAYPILT